MSNTTKTWRDEVRLMLPWLGIPFLPILWPFLVVRTLRGRRELARLTAAGNHVALVEIGDHGWRLKFADGSRGELPLDQIRGGTWFEFTDHNGGFAQTSWQNVLQLELDSSEVLILIGSPSDGHGGERLAELCKSLVTAGRVRGPVPRSADVIPSNFDFAMVAFWLLVLLAVAIWIEHE